MRKKTLANKDKVQAAIRRHWDLYRCMPTGRELAEATGLSHTHARNMMQLLVDDGWLRVVRQHAPKGQGRGHGGKNIYMPADPDPLAVKVRQFFRLLRANLAPEDAQSQRDEWPLQMIWRTNDEVLATKLTNLLTDMEQLSKK